MSCFSSLNMFECKKRKLPDAVLRLPVENGHRDEVLDSFILSALALSAAGGRHTFIVHLAVFEADCDKLRHAGYMRRKHSSFGWTKNRWEPSLDFLSGLAVLSIQRHFSSLLHGTNGHSEVAATVRFTCFTKFSVGQVACALHLTGTQVRLAGLFHRNHFVTL